MARCSPPLWAAPACWSPECGRVPGRWRGRGGPPAPPRLQRVAWSPRGGSRSGSNSRRPPGRRRLAARVLDARRAPRRVGPQPGPAVRAGSGCAARRPAVGVVAVRGAVAGWLGCGRSAGPPPGPRAGGGLVLAGRLAGRRRDVLPAGSVARSAGAVDGAGVRAAGRRDGGACFPAAGLRTAGAAALEGAGAPVVAGGAVAGLGEPVAVPPRTGRAAAVFAGSVAALSPAGPMGVRVAAGPAARLAGRARHGSAGVVLPAAARPAVHPVTAAVGCRGCVAGRVPSRRPRSRGRAETAASRRRRPRTVGGGCTCRTRACAASPSLRRPPPTRRSRRTRHRPDPQRAGGKRQGPPTGARQRQPGCVTGTCGPGKPRPAAGHQRPRARRR